MSRPVFRAAARPATRFLVIFTVLSLLATPVAAAPSAPAPAASSGGSAAPIQPGLLDDLRSGELDRFVVEFTAEADLTGATRINDFDRRGRFVVNRLKQATAAQDAALALVEAAPNARAESFWLRNTLVVYGGAPLARAISSLPGVKVVRAERIYPLVKPVDTEAVVLASEPAWGVEKIGADAVWEDGILGSGIVVANVDTGVQFDHPALVNQYRGNLGGGTFDHNYNWWDPTGICGDEPCDNAGHGTHTMGTMVGGDGPGPFTPDIGVAPGANWIAAKGCEDFGCSDVALLSAGQFILAPTDLDGNNPDPSKRPDIVNNSWGGGPGDEFYLDIVQAWRAAGIIPVFSAGNAGPSCESGGSPGDFLESFSVGATDSDDVIADFSSRGPSPFGKVNPDVAAPGVDVLSSVPGDGYDGTFSGTSMAAPHVAGTLALMLSAELALIGDFDSATTAVRDTALDILDDQCGGAEDGDPNNVYGDGRIDAAAAVALVATGGTLAGTVTDLDTSDPIAGATVTASAGGRDFTATTESDGTYSLFLAAGTYAVSGVAFGYAQSAVDDVVIETDITTNHDVELDALPRFDVTGIVSAASDGAPIEGATVKAVGTPVDPATTDASGAYTLNLPIGSYTLRAMAGGCTEQGLAEVEIIDADVVADFTLARKIDDFGHGCSPIAFDWHDADRRTSLFGDEFVGRIHLPFNFPFYGEEYDEVWVSDNGYINFLGPDQFNSIPIEIPSESDPNAAVYALWKDLHVDTEGAIEFDILGSEPDRVFVLEYGNVMAGSTPVTFELKLWENGDIDLLYADAGNGDDAGIGIENADGTDALQFGFRSEVISDNSAFRFTEVPSGMVSGTVTDANDGEPVEGAVVEALGSGRSTETAADGTYHLRLLTGTYDLEIRADGYTTHTEEISLSDDEELVVDAALLAPIAGVAPTELDATVELGESTERTVTVSNTGSAPLDWEVRERPTSAEPPDLPEILGAPLRIPTWEKPSIPKLPHARTTTLPSEQLTEIITDPEGDGGSVDLVSVRAGADSSEITMELVYASEADAAEGVGYVFLDVDQDPDTGVPAEFFAGLPTQDVGLEFFVDLFLTHDPTPVVLIVDAETFEIMAEAPARVEGDTIGFDVPLEAIGGDDGFVNTALVTGDFFQPTDWAPDEGHGTIEPFSDAPWVAESPESGTVAVGETADVTVTLGGEDVDPGTYTGRLVFLTSDPRDAVHFVDLSLEVALPEAFGGASGTVMEAHTFEPLAATLAIDAELEGAPYPIEVTASADGTWRAFGPAGTWPMTATLDGYVTAEGEVTFTAGAMTPGQDVFLHRVQPHAVIDGGPFTIVKRPGNTTHRSVVIGNPDGHMPLDFSVAEVDLTPPPSEEPIGGVGSWISPPEASTDGRANVGATAAQPSSFRWTPDNATTDLSVLVYADDPIHPAPDTFIDQALQQLGIAYTAHYDADFEGFVSDLESGTWDLVIFANDNWGPDSSTFDALQAYVEGGGKLIAHSWVMGDVADHPLWSLMGVAHVGDDIEPPDPVFWWQPSHPAFSVPELVPELTALDELGFLVYGQHVDGSGGDEIAGYTLPGPDPGEAALVIGPSRSTVFRGFIDAQNSADLDEDGLMDGVELWVNLISGIQVGFTSDASWLTVAPLEGTVAVDGTATVTLTVDTTGLRAGVYEAGAIVQTNDPDNRSTIVPVTLVVPAYQRGVNAGGFGYTAGNGVLFRADQEYSEGSFGWFGSSDVERTPLGIAGTTDDPLYRNARVGMSQYRFDVPRDGTYSVQLRFAEIEFHANGKRVFTVFVEGEPVLVNLDVFKKVGARHALNFTFVTEVDDGTLNVRFSGQQGDQPMVAAIAVTHRPDLAE
jgi:subtilisin family serine protease